MQQQQGRLLGVAALPDKKPYLPNLYIRLAKPFKHNSFLSLLLQS